MIGVAGRLSARVERRRGLENGDGLLQLGVLPLQLPDLPRRGGRRPVDLAGLDLALYREAELAAAENVKRVVPPVKLSVRDWLSDAKGQDPYWIAAFLETKTVWHPIGV
jgi:hypothetical protein